MKFVRFKYSIFWLLLFTAVRARSQADNNADNGSTTVTIVGSLVNDSNLPPSNAINQANVPPPPEQQQLAPIEDNIEPTLENGFHMRYQIQSPGSVERMSTLGSSTTSYAGGSAAASVSSGGVKAHHRFTLTEWSFNFKKKCKTWFPHRKKKYHPTLCEKFR